MTVTTDDLATYLGVSDINEARAQMILDDTLAQALAVATVGVVGVDGPSWDNLPSGGEGVVHAAAGRRYTNPTGDTAETVGPFSVTRPAMSGALLSDAETETLRRLAGRGGAFSIDSTPPGAHAVRDPLREDVEDVEQVDLDEAIDV